MAHYMDTQALINSVKRRASVPDSQALVSDDQILDYANEEMALNLIPLIVAKHQDYYLTREEVQLVSNQSRYEIPYRAIGSKLREVAYMDSNGNLFEMFRISTDDVVNEGIASSFSRRFYIEGEEVVLHTQNDSIPSGYLVFFYNLRPNTMVDSDNVGIITNIDRNTGIVTLSSFPSDFTATIEYDFIKTRSPHRIFSFDITPSSVDANTKTITFDVDEIPDRLTIGDRIALANETDLINAPSDVHVLLAQMVAGRVLESIGDLDNLQAANVKLNKMEKNTGLLIDNRVTGSPYKAKVRNGFLRGRSRNRKYSIE